LTKTLSFEVDKMKFETIDNSFLKCKFYAIAEGENLNQSTFTIESMNRALPTVINKPILAYYDANLLGKDGIVGDMLGHESNIHIDPITGEIYYSYLDKAEKCVGIIPESSDVKIETYRGKRWLTFTGLIFTEYNYELVKLLKRRRFNDVSVEVRVDSSEIDENEWETIHDFSFMGITLLGSNIAPGISDAHLELDTLLQSDEFLKFRKEFSMNYEKINKSEFINKDAIGKRPALTIDKSKDSLSSTPWGDVNKSALVKDIFEASNWRTAMQSAFMLLEDGWSEGKEGSCKYPVMQKKGNKLVYNKGGIASALGYAKKEGVSSVVRKVEAIRKKMGLDDPEKEKESIKMTLKNVSENYKLIFSTAEFAFFGCDGKVMAHPVNGEEEDFSEEKLMQADFVAEVGEEKERYEVSEEFTQYADESEDEKKELAKKLEEEVDKSKEKEEEYAKLATESKTFEDEKADFEKKLAEAEDEKSKKELELDEAKKELEKLSAEFASLRMARMSEDMNYAVDEDEDLDEDEKEEFKAKISEGKFASVEDFEKDLAYAKYVKAKEIKKAKKDEMAKMQFSLVNSEQSDKSVISDPVTAAAKAVGVIK